MTTAPKAIPPSFNGWNAEYLDEQYRRFLHDPGSVAEDMRAFFAGFDLAQARTEDGRGELAEPAVSPQAGTPRLQSATDSLIAAYRRFGHLAADLDPFGRPRHGPESMTLEHWGLNEEDLDKEVDTGTLAIPCETTLGCVIDYLERTYCRHVGLEYLHIQDTEQREWLLGRMEQHEGLILLTEEERIGILDRLTRAETFDAFLGKRYPGEKRFSLGGAESLIPLLDRIIDQSGETGVDEIVMGMAHRGRLSVLNNILGKTYEQVFTEFEDRWFGDIYDSGGDVKYHRGYSSDHVTSLGKKMRLVMASNPSHLEAVDPVVLGRCRAKQRLKADLDRRRVIPLLIHGDAAVAAQGIVAEVLNLSQLEGYTTGGTIHVVVNNHIGFTTRPEDARTSRYCTDVAKMIEAPVFHVNGEDPEAVVSVAQFAVEFRQKFKKDVFIDLWCYRRFGHNEQDEMSFTQPLLAELLGKRPSVMRLYALRLFGEGVISEEGFRETRDRVTRALDEAQEAARKKPKDPTIDPGSWRWQGFTPKYTHDLVDTSISAEHLLEICGALGSVPDGFTVNPKLKRLLETRGGLHNGGGLCHADAELLAFGSLLLEGVAIRLSGQDSRRGTFSQRHSVLYDLHTSEPFVPLNNIRELGVPGTERTPGTRGPDGQPRQARLCVYDSALSEASVLGFDYGYSLADPNMLVLWEAQFGDFANGAQVIIDQFVASAEVKWERWSGLVLLLPHGHEGAGPEHSSCRIERFLQLGGDDNIQVVYPSTAAQYFHVLRRQVKRSFRKPLIVATPKGLLRAATSTIEDVLTGGFREVIDDPGFEGKSRSSRRGVRQINLCTGKIYHEMAARREETGRDDVAIIRIEQLYPFHASLLRQTLAEYPKSAQIIWVQEEPRNMGAYLHIADCLRTELGIEPEYAGREASGTPAAGSKTIHKARQEKLLAEAIGPRTDAEA